MGGKHTKSDLIIKKSLLSGFKTGSELYTTVLNRKPHNNKEEIDKTRKAFIYGLNNLLENREIEIIGYRKRNSKPKQSFNFDPFFFDLIGKDEHEILLLLNQLDGSNLENVKLARNKLWNCFKHKNEQFESKELNSYNEIKGKVDLKSLKDWINEIKVEIEEIEEIEKKIEEIEKKDKIKEEEVKFNKNNPHIANLISRKGWYERNLENIQKSYEKNGDTYYWRLRIKDLTLEEMDKINVILPALEKNEFPNVESFLGAKGIYKPLQRNFKEIRRQFREILFFILSENNKLKNYFSLALSNDEESLLWFEKFIKHNYTKYTEGELSFLLDKTEYVDSEKEERVRLKEHLENLSKE